MGSSNKDRIGEALEVLREELYPYVKDNLQTYHGDDWIIKSKLNIQAHHKSEKPVEDVVREDVAILLGIIKSQWDKVFKAISHPSDRTFVIELITLRNSWAHQSTFSNDDTYRALDTIVRFLDSISSSRTEKVKKQRQEILHLLSQEQARNEIRVVPVSAIEEERIRKRLEDLLKHLPFQNAYFLNQALTHTSYKYENPNTGEDNEKLEFLGDALLTFLSADFLRKWSPTLTEGEMTVLRSKLVDAPQLASFASRLELGKWMRLGRGEDAAGGRSKNSLLSNVFEAVIGAYYIDSGIEIVCELINPFFEDAVDKLCTTEDTSIEVQDDPKSLLQKVVLDQTFSGNPNRKPPEYKTIRSNGTDNDPEFTAVVYVAGGEYGAGKDRSKKEAEKRAAEDALRKLGVL